VIKYTYTYVYVYGIINVPTRFSIYKFNGIMAFPENPDTIQDYA